MGLIFVGLYVACEIIANVTAGRPVSLFNIVVPSAVFIYTITFTLVDVIHEIYGKEGTRKVVYGAFLANIILAVYSYLVIHLPAPSFFTERKAYEIVFGSTPRIVAASLIAYLVSSLVDIEVYHLWKSRVQRAKWSRVLVSNSISTFVDSCAFITIAFMGVMPVIPLIVGQYTVKMGITILSLPLIYATGLKGSIAKHAGGVGL
ncbi:queuosine precursor transporter [Syntrophorhabdus aromaticivorans]|uniref:Probable queuosine precursor transporter n=1 Tax=Syntrophorhabdus aromaticivorans TaxID=328301 RepID=A0A351U5H9_9BACT|nr:queuosine precursor transporter [Syntrophorhabdus aromaticivorans]NLW36805.1 queuosine precursor transporter [Syntrophorhabdus aromaticivorans]HBA55210.1 transporter [Syntrophorhabdus aromaticivorans]